MTRRRATPASTPLTAWPIPQTITPARRHAVRATSGDILVRGKRVDIRSTTDAIALGIETIYQDSALVTQLSIARNLFLGREPLKGPRFLNRMDAALMEQVAGELLKRVGIGKSIPASTPISSLSGGERQAVAIARAMHFDSDLIILDEPTNNLGVAETQGVLRFVRNARDSGHSCIFIAHNIHHVFQVVDRNRGHAPGKDRRRRHRPEAHDGRRGRGRHHRRTGGTRALIDAAHLANPPSTLVVSSSQHAENLSGFCPIASDGEATGVRRDA